MNHELTERERDATSDAEPEHKRVRGWLLLLCVSLAIINPLLAFTDAVVTFRYNGLHPAPLPGISRVVTAGVLLEVGVACFSLYAGFTLWAVMPNAVKVAKAYLLAHLSYAVITFLMPLLAGLSPQDSWIMLRLGMNGLARSFIYVAAWYAYLSRSERVKATYAEDAGVL